jgi:GntR family transcriptional regulator/MocR family aminotransferase
MLGFGGLSIEEIEKGVRLLASCLREMEIGEG